MSTLTLEDFGVRPNELWQNERREIVKRIRDGVLCVPIIGFEGCGKRDFVRSVCDELKRRYHYECLWVDASVSKVSARGYTETVFLRSLRRCGGDNPKRSMSAYRSFRRMLANTDCRRLVVIDNFDSVLKYEESIDDFLDKCLDLLDCAEEYWAPVIIISEIGIDAVEAARKRKSAISLLARVGVDAMPMIRLERCDFDRICRRSKLKGLSIGVKELVWKESLGQLRSILIILDALKKTDRGDGSDVDWFEAALQNCAKSLSEFSTSCQASCDLVKRLLGLGAWEIAALELSPLGAIGKVAADSFLGLMGAFVRREYGKQLGGLFR